MVGAVVELADRAGQVQDAAAVPALPEGVLQVVHGGPAHLGLDVMPRRPRPVAAGEIHHLRVAVVLGVVAPAVAQVDPAYERDVAAGGTRMPDHHQLLVMAAGPAGPGVEQHLAAVLVNLPDELGVGFLGLPQRLGLGAPEQAEDLHPPARGAAEYVTDGRVGTVEQFVQVTAEVQEVDLVAGLGRVQFGVQPGEVAAPVHQRLDQVPDREGAQVGGGVGPVAIAQEPAPDGRVVDRVVGGILFERVVSRIGSTWKHVRIVASPGGCARRNHGTGCGLRGRGRPVDGIPAGMGMVKKSHPADAYRP